MALIPVFGRLSVAQAWWFAMAAALAVTPVVLLSLTWLVLTGRPAGMSSAISGHQGIVRFHAVDSLMLLYVLVHCISAWWNGLDAAVLTPVISLLAFYTGWRLGLGGQRALLPPVVLACIGGLGLVLSTQAVTASTLWNPLFGLNETLAESAERASLLTLLGHPNYLGSSLVLLFFVQLDAAMRGGYSALIRGCLGCGLALNILALYFVGARGASLAVVAGLLYAAATMMVMKADAARWFRRLIISLALLMVMAMLAMTWLAWRSLDLERAKGPAGRSTVSERLLSHREILSRLHNWTVARELAAMKPMVGHGPGSLNRAYWKHLSRQVQSFPLSSTEIPRQSLSSIPLGIHPILLDVVNGANPGHVHNELLHALAETGTLGLVSLLALVSVVLVRAHLVGAPIIAAGLFAFGVDGMFNFPLHLPLSGALFALVLAMVAQGPEFATFQPGRAATLSAVAGYKSRVAFLIVGILLLLYSALASPRLIREAQAMHLLQVSRLANNADEKGQILYDALAKDPRNAAVRRDLVDYNLGRGRIQEARHEAQILLDESGHPFVMFRLAEARLQSGDIAGASTDFATIARLVPRHLPTAERRVEVHRNLYQFQRQAHQGGAAVVNAAASDLIAAIDALRLLDFDHPLAYFAEAQLNRAELGTSRAVELMLVHAQRATERRLPGKSGIEAAQYRMLLRWITDELESVGAELR